MSISKNHCPILKQNFSKNFFRDPRVLDIDDFGKIDGKMTVKNFFLFSRAGSANFRSFPLKLSFWGSKMKVKNDIESDMYSA